MRRKRTSKRAGARLSRVDGRLLTLPSDPQPVTREPWWRLTVQGEISATSPTDVYGFTVSSLNAYLQENYGINISDTVPWSIKIHKVSVWETTGVAFELAVFDLTQPSTQQNPLMVREDAPGRNQWARMGYIWPATSQAVPLSSVDTPRQIFALDIVAEAARFQFHLDVSIARSNESYSSRSMTVVLPEENHRH